MLIAGWLLMPTALRAEDLLTAYNLARANDAKFRAAQSVYLAERERLPQARAGLMPTINARAERDRNNSETTTDSFVISRPSARFDYSSSEYSLRLSQPVYNAAIFSGFSQAKVEVLRAEAEYAAAGQDLILRVARAYLEQLLAQDSLEFSHAERILIQRQLESAEARLKAGLATITDVHDARARFEIAAAQETEAENTLQDKREALRELTGHSTESLAIVGANMPLIAPEPADINQWVEKSLQQNSSLLAKRAAAESASEEIKRQRAGHYPTLDLVGTLTRNDADKSIVGPGIRTDSTVVGLQLNVPLFQGGLVSSRTEEAARRHDAAQQEFEATRRATERETRSFYLGVTGGTVKVTALSQAVVASESALEAKTQGFTVGINTNLDVLDATRDLYRTKRDLSSTRYDYLINMLRLKQAAGTLSESDLLQINGWLQAP
ncbi:MAG: TolC family outer membrane protein [Gammaproteobacteria bacterium]|nr:TolC family outer membrane protein [Gammaproteobacteria bacterium]